MLNQNETCTKTAPPFQAGLFCFYGSLTAAPGPKK